MSEQRHRTLIELTQLISCRKQTLQRPMLVAIDGVDGSGKTVFADELVQTMHQQQLTETVLIHGDDFFEPKKHSLSERSTKPHRVF